MALMTAQDFVKQLEESTLAAVERLGEASAGGEPGEEITIAQLLLLALKNELEAAEIAAIWMADCQELDVKLALARQCGDEAKHYRLVQERLQQMGVDTRDHDPRLGGYTAMFEYLKSLPTTVERVAAGQFTRERLAMVRNEVFTEYCVARGDEVTAKLYRETINPDEAHHHELGRRLLLRYADTPEKQELARRAAEGTLRVAEEVQEMARLRRGIYRAPGC